MTAPRVTVGVPVYNGEKYLPAALDSLVDQDFADMEIIISDNASTDGTQAIAQEVASRDERVIYHRQESNIGGALNLKTLLDKARGSLFKWAYYDDVCLPSLISASVQALDEAGPEAVVAYSRVQVINGLGLVIGAHDDAHLGLDAAEPHVRLRNLFSKIVTQTQFGLIRTEVLRAVGGASTQIGGEFVLPAQLCLRGKVILVNEPLLQLRSHPGQHGGNRRTEMRWIDPTGTKRVIFPYSRANTLLLDVILRAPLSSAERRRCVAVLARHFTLRQWRYLASDLRHLSEDLTRHWK